MAKNKSKKIKSNSSQGASMPYFLINSTGQIKHFGYGGYDTEPDETILTGDKYADNKDPLAGMPAMTSETELANPNSSGTDTMGAVGSAVGAVGSSTGMNSTYSQVGNIAGDAVGSIDESKDSAVMSGVLSGAGTGATIGSAIGPWGTAIGAVVGGVAGGISSASEHSAAGTANRELMQDRDSYREKETTKYYGALGGELPIMAFGGPTDPPDGGDNPHYDAQMKLYNESLTNGPTSNLTATATPDMLKKYQSHMASQYPEYQGLNVNKMVYDPNSINPQTGLPDQLLDYYDKPNRQLPANTNQAPSPQAPVAPREYSYLDPNTGAPLPADKYGRPTGGVDVQFNQGSDLSTRTLQAQSAQQAVADEQAANKAMLLNLTPEQQAEARSTGMTAVKYAQSKGLTFANGGDMGAPLDMADKGVEFNGNTHEDGGIKVGKAEVEDNEVKVGNYVFSDRLMSSDGKSTFATAAKKVLKKFEEYENDQPSMKTQDKMLKILAAENDQARAIREQEDAQMEKQMAEGYTAYGGMISQDKKGKYVVDRSNRMSIMDGARNSKMSYNKYVDGIYKYGGKLLDKGGTDPNDEFDKRGSVYNFPGAQSTSVDGLPIIPAGRFDTGTGTLAGDGNIVESLPTRSLSEPGMELNRAPGYEIDNLPIMSVGTDEVGKTLSPNTEMVYNPKVDKRAPREKWGNEEKALFAADLPALGNLIASGQKDNTKFDRLNLDEISLDNEREALRSAISRAKGVNRANVRGTATSAGDALATLSAGNAGLTDMEMRSISESYSRENNANIQSKNQERMTNTNIAMQEAIAKQQDEAMIKSVRSMAVANLSDNTQGYLKDKKMAKANKAYNKQLLSLLDSGEYKVEMNGDDIKIVYKDPKTSK